jgi:hypothetical protein
MAAVLRELPFGGFLVKNAYLLLAVLSLSLILCDASTAENKPRIFTNEDLSKRGTPNVSEPAAGQTHTRSAANNKNTYTKASSDKGKERWCKKGRLYQNRVDEAKAYLNEAVRKYAEAKEKAAARSPKKKRKLQKAEVSDSGVRKARLKLERAEKRLLDIEQEAHRKNIPPGWLRCQFSY